jgi:hypothetical protein
MFPKTSMRQQFKNYFWENSKSYFDAISPLSKNSSAFQVLTS